MANLGNLNAPEVYLCAKNGCGLKYLSKKYDAHEDQIVNRIKRIFKSSERKATKLLKTLKENDEKAKKPSKNKDVNMANASEQQSEVPTKTKNAEADAPANGATEEPTLDELTAEEDKVSQEKCSLEAARNDIMCELRKDRDMMREHQSHRDELEKEYAAMKQEYEDLCLASNKRRAEMSELTAQIRQKENELDQIRSRKAKAQEIAVYVRNDETISAPDANVQLDDSGFERISNKLIRRPECRKLAVWQIDLLARAIRVSVRLEKEGYNGVFLFDNSDIEQAYSLLVAEYRTAKQQSAATA